MEEDPEIVVRVAVRADVKHVYPILEEMERSARVRGTGIGKRSPRSICNKIYEGKAVIALTGNNDWVEFYYVDRWSNGEFVSNSGLIVNPAYRRRGIATAIKQMIFDLSRKLYPEAKIFSITTGAAILRLNSKLGFEPATYSEITDDKLFWDQCRTCINYHILESKGRKMCLCTAMQFCPTEPQGQDRIRIAPINN